MNCIVMVLGTVHLSRHFKRVAMYEISPLTENKVVYFRTFKYAATARVRLCQSLLYKNYFTLSNLPSALCSNFIME